MPSRHVSLITITSTCALKWICVTGCVATVTNNAMTFPGPHPGNATALVQNGHLELGNKALTMSWNIADSALTPDRLIDHLNGTTMKLDGDVFRVVCTDGGSIRASDMRVVGIPRVTALCADPDSPKLADRCCGRQIVVDLVNASGVLAAEWRAELRDDSNYVRTIVTLHANGSGIPITDLVLIDLAGPGAKQLGAVDGSPIVTGHVFLALEHPMARNTAGHPVKEIGTWGPADVSYPEHTELKWDVTGEVGAEGTYDLLFEYTNGAHRLEIFRTALREDGKEVAHDEHFGATGSAHQDNHYSLDLKRHRTGAVYVLVADVRSDGGTDSRGKVSISHRKGMPRIRCALPYNVALPAGESVTESAVIGVVPTGQLRRGFLYYVERERAHPYRPFLHYNSWYDIGYFSEFDEADCLRVVHAFGSELVEKRGVVLDSFLFDDGWDDHESLWSFHKGLPGGFLPIRHATLRYGAAPGVWLSPWGGYGEPRKRRLQFGESAGYETNENGFVLSAPRYYHRFHDTCLKMIYDFGINHFKFDGIGRASGRYPGSEFGSDFQAAIHLIRDLREANPDIYINLTTGTWPSPFWLQHADSIWRGGYDHEFAGVGTDRQKWMTYRDSMIYQNVVRRAPLFPLNSLMLHGIIYAKHARGLNSDPDGDLQDEIRTAFGCGTQLQEMYISPELLTEGNWNDLAETARWARSNAHVLRDTHWIGGDPAKLDVYGWASWSPSKGILVLRNPSDKAQDIEIDVELAFQLPAGAQRTYQLSSPFPDVRFKPLELRAGDPRTMALRPFEVVILESRSE